MPVELERFGNRAEILGRISGSAVAVIIYSDSPGKAAAFADAFGPLRVREQMLLVDLGSLEPVEVARLRGIQTYYAANGMVDGDADQSLFAEIIVRGRLPVSMVNSALECRGKLVRTRQNLWKSALLEN